jgi:N-acetylneuraminic acid mutarotase
MYVLGGLTASVLKFDSVQDSWTEVAPMPEMRYAFAACAVGNDIYVFGGGGNGLRGGRASVFKFGTEADTWSTLTPMPHACANRIASLLDGLVYIVGAGTNYRGVLRFDPASDAWSTLADTSSSRIGSTPFVVGGSLFTAGAAGNDTSLVERYDVASDTWTAMANMLEGRCYHKAVTFGSVATTEKQDFFDSLIAKASSKFRSRQP